MLRWNAQSQPPKPSHMLVHCEMFVSSAAKSGKAEGTSDRMPCLVSSTTSSMCAWKRILLDCVQMCTVYSMSENIPRTFVVE